MRSQASERRSRYPVLPFRQRFSALWRDSIAGWAIRFSFLFTLLLLVIILTFFWSLPPQIPLTYSRPWGVEQLVPSFFLFFLFVIVLILTIVNSLIAALIFSSEEILARIFAWTSVLVVFLINITVLRVVLLIT